MMAKNGRAKKASSDQFSRKQDRIWSVFWVFVEPYKEWKLRFSECEVVNSDRNHILLTGCTGFIGPVLLCEILKANPDTPVICLIRAKAAEDAISRLKEHEEKSELHFDFSRIKVVCGDLSKPHLGLHFEQWDDIISKISVIYHNGARVNSTLPYEFMKDTNVDGSLWIAKLAVQAQVELKYVLSLSAIHPKDVWSTNPRVSSYNSQELKRFNGYGISKHVSEVLLNQVSRLQLQIFRPGTIIGHKDTLFTNESDFWNLFLLACYQLHSYPTNATTWLSWTTVNDVVRSILHVCDISVVNINDRAFPLCQLLQVFGERNDLEPVSHVEWANLLKTLSEDSVAFPLSHKFVRAPFRRKVPPPHAKEKNAEGIRLKL